MHEQRRARAQRGFRFGESGRVHDQRQLVRARFFAGRGDERLRRRNRKIFVDDVPDLDRVRSVRREITDAAARCLCIFQRDELPLGGKVQPVIERRQQRTGGNDARRTRVVRERFIEFQRPRKTADVEHGRDAGTDVRAREALRVRFQIGFYFFVRMFRANVERVRPRIRPSGLREVHVRVDESRRDPHRFRIDDGHAFRHRAVRSCAVDFSIANDDVRVRDRRASAAVDQRCADERARRRGCAGRRVDRAGDRDLPSDRRAQKQPLRNPGMLVGAVAHAIAIRAVDDAVLHAQQMNVRRIDRVRPAAAGVLREIGEAGRESRRATARELFALQVVRQILRAIALANRFDVLLEHRSRGGEVLSFIGGERKSDEEQRESETAHVNPLQLVKEVPIPAAVLVNWIRALASVPCRFGAAVYLSMNEQLNSAIDAAATREAERRA